MPHPQAGGKHKPLLVVHMSRLGHIRGPFTGRTPPTGPQMPDNDEPGARAQPPVRIARDIDTAPTTMQ